MPLKTVLCDWLIKPPAYAPVAAMSEMAATDASQRPLDEFI
jgi:hypothetical protein